MFFLLIFSVLLCHNKILAILMNRPIFYFFIFCVLFLPLYNVCSSKPTLEVHIIFFFYYLTTFTFPFWLLQTAKNNQVLDQLN